MTKSKFNFLYLLSIILMVVLIVTPFVGTIRISIFGGSLVEEFDDGYNIMEKLGIPTGELSLLDIFTLKEQVGPLISELTEYSPAISVDIESINTIFTVATLLIIVFYILWAITTLFALIKLITRSHGGMLALIISGVLAGCILPIIVVIGVNAIFKETVEYILSNTDVALFSDFFSQSIGDLITLSNWGLIVYGVAAISIILAILGAIFNKKEISSVPSHSYSHTIECGAASSVSAHSAVNRCIGCGTELGADAAFCPNCGKAVETRSSVSSKIPLKCAVCGQVLESDTVFCPGCGNRVGGGRTERIEHIDFAIDTEEPTKSGIREPVGVLDKTPDQTETVADFTVSGDKIDSKPGVLKINIKSKHETDTSVNKIGDNESFKSVTDEDLK